MSEKEIKTLHELTWFEQETIRNLISKINKHIEALADSVQFSQDNIDDFNDMARYVFSPDEEGQYVAIVGETQFNVHKINETWKITSDTYASECHEHKIRSWDDTVSCLDALAESSTLLKDVLKGKKERYQLEI